MLDNSESITEEILLYFEKLYLSPPGESWRVEGIDWDKAPGPDGFTIAMFQDCWDVIKEDLVIAKILLGRLRGVLYETIHSTQGAFVQGRQILDAVLIANEIVDEKRRSGEEGVSKLTLKRCLSSVFYAILVNGNAKGWVKASRGLRQGDPLSPFLFTIVADVLSRMMLRAEERNMLEGFRVEELQTLKSLLLVFGQISRLKVNLDKSNLFGINLDQNHLCRLALLLDCKASNWPILYLGLPLGGNPIACGFWDLVIERISRRLDGWKKTYLSFGGVGEGKRDHLVSWDVVCKPRIKGGSGFGKISLRNLALLGKWLWRYHRESTTLWHQVILSIYGTHSNGWDAKLKSDGHIVVLGRLWHKSFRVFPSILGLW
ncbi:hypothetical protein CK203_041523 [Vitis vinifera]|uniref:Uncharacterized protein n=1 Tax=Vitis vinifera TaxID=29760 RepID=A0A438HNB5_VITVI|nr:hypothetical protein CK203_041523 [Vitis vinifera]